jgi:hypothetical protein
MRSAQITNLAAEIVSAVARIPAAIPPGRGNREWTTAIKRSLITLGRTRGYDVCTSGFPDECEREWLFDLIWYRNEPQDHLREIGLIVESEWSRDLSHIKYDFEKLLIAKSPIKMMIFQDYKYNLTELWSLLETAIRTFQAEPADEKYLLAGYENAKNAFAIRQIPA